MSWVKNVVNALLGRETKQYVVVELKAPRSTQQWSKETKDAVATLPFHPGFSALMDRVNLHRQMLVHKLATEFHKDQRESDYQQAGVYWLGYIQELVSKATAVPQAPRLDPMQEELEAFRAIDATIERVGMEE